MFIYCFDEQEKTKLAKSLKLFKKSNVGGKPCWIFLIDKNNKFNFNEVDRSKCVISNRMNF
jgi:hypothetical protein